MTIWHRFTFIMKSSMTALRERFDDPERALHQLIIDMEGELAKVKHSVANAIADEILLRKRLERAASDTKKWAELAAEALRRSNEVDARAALERKVDAERLEDRLRAEHDKQVRETQKLREAVERLEDQLRAARNKRTLLLARLIRAESQRNVNSALDRADAQSAFREFERLEERVDRAEAVGEAWERLAGHDPEDDDLEKRFEGERRREQLDAELDELRRKVTSEDAVEE